MSWQKRLFFISAVIAVICLGIYWYVAEYMKFDIYVPMYAQNCASCHGKDLRGTDKGVALIDNYLKGGDTIAGLMQSIRQGNPDAGMPAFHGELTELEIKGLAIYIGEKRLGQNFADMRFDAALKIPATVQTSEAHNFVLETLIDGLSPIIFSIEPLPDGSWLISEKERGLSIISPDGVQSAPIKGTPKTGSSFGVLGIRFGLGWLLDVAKHPNYEENGWIYLHYTDLCEDCSMLLANSMNRLDRGRIVNGEWVDVETIWQAPKEFYTSAPDTGAGGRITFDDAGHVYMSVGIKAIKEGTEGDITPQNLNIPYGKIHRINDDGTVPSDNPFATASQDTPFTRQTIWTYGHRSPQGLEWNPLRNRVWNAEMGPRGGDEINELLPGKNYGWPFHSFGLEYSGISVERFKSQDIAFDVATIETTLVDITPSPAISSFAFYRGERFPQWQHNVLIGSLKGSSLFRMVFNGTTLIHRETLIKDLARIRDIEIGYDGLVYLLLENKAGSAIVRLVPTE